jgi:mRNA-degrading endonuclease RelE of RelBE toxin-antitoxin system
VKYARTERFKKAYAKLPPEIQVKVIKAFQLFKNNPRHPSLGVKRVQGLNDVWEGRIDIHYRFTFHYEEDVCVFRNIGPHSIVEREP